MAVELIWIAVAAFLLVRFWKVAVFFIACGLVGLVLAGLVAAVTFLAH